MRKNYYPKTASGAEFSIEGFNQNRLLAELAKKDVTVYNVKRTSRKMLTLTVRSRDKNSLVETAEKLGFTLAEKRKLGSRATFLHLLPRMGLALAFAAFIAAYALASGFVWRVEIEGNKSVDSYTIAAVLADNGAKAGSGKKDLDFSSLERALRALDGISEATVSMRGTTLKVSVLESLDYVPRPSGGKTVATSNYDAEITRIILRRGTALVSAGQRIFKGTPLISGELTGTDGSVIGSGYVDGEVYGRVVFTESVTVALSGVKTEPTGNVKRSTVLSLWGLKIGKRSDGFEYADVKEESETLSPFIPIKVTSITVAELSRIEYSLERSEAVDNAKAHLRTLMSERFIGKLEDEKFIVRDIADNMISVELYVTAEILIS